MISPLISLLISLLIVGLILAVFWWILGMIPIPPQFKWIVQVIVAIVFLIALIELLTGGLVILPHGVLR